MEKTVKLLNKTGLHARPAALFVAQANKFKSSISLEKDGKLVNAKSIMGVMSLGAGSGSVINIIANGTDEEEALDSLVKLIESKFGEA